MTDNKTERLAPGVYARGALIQGDCPLPCERMHPVWVWLPVGVIVAVCGALMALAAWCGGKP